MEKIKVIPHEIMQLTKEQAFELSEDLKVQKKINVDLYNLWLVTGWRNGSGIWAEIHLCHNSLSEFVDKFENICFQISKMSLIEPLEYCDECIESDYYRLKAIKSFTFYDDTNIHGYTIHTDSSKIREAFDNIYPEKYKDYVYFKIQSLEEEMHDCRKRLFKESYATDSVKMERFISATKAVGVEQYLIKKIEFIRSCKK